MNCKIKFALLIDGLVGCCLLGCSGQSDRPATYPVHGKITYQGKPVSNASVAFLADGAPRPAVGTTDEAGQFRLTTYQLDDGAVQGVHVVTVRKMTADAAGTTEVVESAVSDEPADPAEIDRAMEREARAALHARSELPAKYADRKTSDLRREVVAGENEIEIELKD